ncbi:MAG: TetR/AcrR family transcriptional regulator [Opitutales bacterium]
MNKQAAILNAALALFADRGFWGTRVPEIAERAGVAAGTLYTYFRNKEALANELYRQSIQDFGQVFAVPEDGPVKAQFQEFCRRFLAFVFERTTEFKFLEAHCHESYLDAESQSKGDAFDENMRMLFRRWADSGQLAHRDVDLLVALTFGGLMGLFKAQQHGFAEFSPNQRALAIEQLWACLTSPVTI